VGFSAAVATCAGPLGLLIPPSGIQILYAWVGQLSVLACFLATVIPGIILTILLSLVSWIMLKSNPNIVVSPKIEKSAWLRKCRKSTKSAVPALLMPVIILGGIYGGFMTPTEAAAISVFYAIPVSMFIYKGLTFRELKDCFVETATTTGVVMVMLALVMILSRIFIMEDLPDALMSILMGISENPIVIMLMINVFMIIIGMIMDDVSGTLLCTPILLPVVMKLGISPYHFAAILGVNLGMGNITPPSAPLLYLGARIFKVNVAEMLKPCLILILFAYIPTLILTTYIPEVALFLPKLILGSKLGV
jgi:C4-dicarboxylate transporter DctM subunit